MSPELSSLPTNSKLGVASKLFTPCSLSAPSHLFDPGRIKTQIDKWRSQGSLANRGQRQHSNCCVMPKTHCNTQIFIIGSKDKFRNQNNRTTTCLQWSKCAGARGAWAQFLSGTPKWLPLFLLFQHIQIFFHCLYWVSFTWGSYNIFSELLFGSECPLIKSFTHIIKTAKF